MAAILALPFAVALPARASDVGIDFNNHSFNVFAGTSLDRFISNTTNAEVAAGFLYDGHNPGDHLEFFHADLLATGGAGVPGLTGGIGLRGYYGDRDDFSGGGAAIGGRLVYFFPQFNRIGVSGDLWYSPDVLTAGDFQHYFEFAIDVNYRVLRQAMLFVGYRRVGLPVEGPLSHVRARAPSQGLHLGLRINF